MIDINIEYEKLRRAEERIINYSDGMEKAFEDSYDRSMGEIRRRTDREIMTAIQIEKADELQRFGVEDRIVDRVLSKESVLKIEDSRTIPLNAFRARQTPVGVEVYASRFMPAGVVFAHAFGPEIAKLGRDIYRRVSKRRFPIEKIRDLKVKEIDGVKQQFDRGVSQAKAILEKNLRRAKEEINKEFGRDVYATSQT